jgi:LytS/YehU family sensor histidine kinase
VSKFEDCISEIIENIRADRDSAAELLNDAKNYIQQNVENHKTVGTTMAKYIEALQRSNDQLIKVGNILQKDLQKEEDLEFSEEELEQMHSDWKKEE